MNFSTNKKLNYVLNDIADDLKEMGLDEVKRYKKEFPREIDYNLAQYGNLRVYYSQLRELYKDYKTLEKVSDTKLWNIYLRQVGWVARKLLAA